MIAALVLAAAPCMVAPVRHHKHHKPGPLQSCAAPVVPMCFRDSPPDPVIEPVPTVRPYYIDVPVQDDESGEGVWIEDTAYLGSAGYNVEGISASYSVGGISYRGPPSPPRAVVPVRTPEISGAGGAAGITLLLGMVAVLKRAAR